MDIIYFLDMSGVLVFAISGALSASDKNLDLFGAFFAAFITALGGGTIRDLVLGSTPVIWATNMDYFIVIGIAIVLTYFFKRHIMQWKKTLFIFDTIGIGVFTIIGLEKSLSLGFNPIVSMVMGVVTAVMGGVLRDTFVNDIPLIFRKEIYATACIIGAATYILLNKLELSDEYNLVLTTLLIIIIRTLAIRYKLSLPRIDRSAPE
ncbi:MAG: trimeric intracellular cation channel family protein [Marinifilaceae bacterium]|nr:trimeric intracellular cation channel family protein [Marinifilaceae bacterium]